MHRFVDIARELYGLVVDDGIMALAVLAWTFAVWLMVSRLDLSPTWGALALWAGVAAVLVESTLRRARH